MRVSRRRDGDDEAEQTTSVLVIYAISQTITVLGEIRRRPALAYAMAAGFGGVSLVPRLALSELLVGVPFLTVFPAIAISAFLGGFGPGMTAAVVGGLGAWYIVAVLEQETPPVETPDVLVLALYFVVAALISLVIGWLLEALEQNRKLLLELQHRVKNHVQLVSAIVGIQARKAPSAEARRELERIRSRLNAVTGAYSTLYEPGTRLDVATLLRSLASRIERDLKSSGARITVRGGALEWTMDRVVPLMLIAHELLLNALQHAPEREPPRAEISLGRGNAHCELRVSGGRPLPPDFDPARANGLGLQIVTRLAEELDGTLIVEHGPNPVFSVRFPA